jgi:hypothetical protein
MHASLPPVRLFEPDHPGSTLSIEIVYVPALQLVLAKSALSASPALDALQGLVAGDDGIALPMDAAMRAEVLPYVQQAPKLMFRGHSLFNS